MNCKRFLYIGANFGTLNFFEEDGTAVAQAPYVTLHSKEEGKYYVADSVTLNEDEVSYDAVFTSDVTKRMKEGEYALEVYTDETMTNQRYYDPRFCTAVIVSATPGQQNDSKEEA